MKKIFPIVCFLLAVLCSESSMAQTDDSKNRSYDDVVRDMGKRSQTGMDSLYRQATKVAASVQEVADQIDLSKVTTTGKVVVAGDTIDFQTPAKQLYDSIMKTLPK